MPTDMPYGGCLSVGNPNMLYVNATSGKTED